MNPENVTTSQIVGSFTAKHWVATTTTLFTGISLIAGGAYWAGQKLTEAQSLAQIAQLQAKLEASQSRAEFFATENGQCRDAYQKSQDMNTQKAREVDLLTTQLARENNCSFIHEQIRAIRFDMEHTNNFLVSSEGQDEKQNFQKALLEKRLEGYQQQLGSCNK